VLGLSHALNYRLLHGARRKRRGGAAAREAVVDDVRFAARCGTRVAQESPELYFEIQSLNDYGAESLEALSQAIERLRSAVISQDFEAFATLMRRGREYLEDRRSVSERRA
jgi:chorismate mutase/prephenate dehydrogenase